MGPHFFKCGKWRQSANRLPSGSASMGPHFFKCGKRTRLRKYGALTARFNGAALFQVRKVLFTTLRIACQQRLQWGRTFSSAESAALMRRFNLVVSSFNGAALFQVRKDRESSVPPQTAPASMGPHFFKCGKMYSCFKVAYSANASMGPHFFKCGKLYLTCLL